MRMMYVRCAASERTASGNVVLRRKATAAMERAYQLDPGLDVLGWYPPGDLLQQSVSRYLQHGASGSHPLVEYLRSLDLSPRRSNFQKYRGSARLVLLRDRWRHLADQGQLLHFLALDQLLQDQLLSLLALPHQRRYAYPTVAWVPTDLAVVTQ